ncbi:hypothetical protein [Sinomonas terrae]|uniref:Uncharacterized protein n=1 Tax=Sinomonas terrae TaxID=2908838 RepID=A0ABS9TXQ5_9MICC|nr:hypothetical protein [Sinomonas terrae]MCH6469199.1 hypothetical protein [Sinomonas terrae]
MPATIALKHARKKMVLEIAWRNSGRRDPRVYVSSIPAASSFEAVTKLSSTSGARTPYAPRSRFIPATSRWSSRLPSVTRRSVSVPSTSRTDASPMAMTQNPVPNPVACATSASTTKAAEDTVRWMVIRLMSSPHSTLRVARRLQCSVARSWATTAGDGAEGVDDGERADTGDGVEGVAGAAVSPSGTSARMRGGSARGSTLTGSRSASSSAR